METIQLFFNSNINTVIEIPGYVEAFLKDKQGSLKLPRQEKSTRVYFQFQVRFYVLGPRV